MHLYRYEISLIYISYKFSRMLFDKRILIIINNNVKINNTIFYEKLLFVIPIQEFYIIKTLFVGLFLNMYIEVCSIIDNHK